MGETRREFLKKMGLTGAAIAAGGIRALADKETSKMPMRTFGKIGWKISALGYGCAELGEEKEAVAAINAALDGGVNYIDVAPSYQGTRSGQYVGIVAKSRRKELYLATKALMRDKAGALREIKESLERLNTKKIDLLQIHAVNDMQSLDKVLMKGGAIEGLEEAKKAQLIGHIGITGHTRPEVILKALERYPFESILVPLSAADAHLYDFADDVLPKAKKMGIAIVGMKVLKGAELGRELPANPSDLIHYTLSLPISTAIIGMPKPAHVRQNLQAVYQFKSLDKNRLAAIKQSAQSYANEKTLWWKQH